ncbi:hypothetical protein N0K08_17540 [Acidovorax sp. Be4]|uniref:Uncharacterized protein n=1 Tax=Acidovorax bellezanensis TaxID=2976702 RepID=A0ABT2PQA1_9BURK|nr:hypothetical protein [Acidovorax sp. Be4]MCT9812450.1 hypothetical protein [Acidovorax sp. Be4]
MKLTYWILALLITLGVGHIAAQASTEADLEDAAALSSREFAGQAMCGPHATAVWTDDKSLECLRNLP